MDQQEQTELTIMEIKHYARSDGIAVQEFVPTNGDPSFFRGTATVSDQSGKQVGRMEFRFPEGINIEEAFEQFPEVADQAIQKEMARQKIVSAHSVPDLSIVGPNGSPIKNPLIP